jgi:hypothetical protein
MQNDYRLVPANPDDLYWIADKEAVVFGHNLADVMPVELLQSWYRKNPACFWMIIRGGEERIGNIYIFPLKPEALHRLTAGEIMERDIKPQDLFSPGESARINALHITSLVCPNSSAGVLYCLRHFSEIARAICDPRQISHIYALSASKRGDLLIRNSGFTEIVTAAERRDKHPYYAVKYSDFVDNPRLHRKQD